MNNVSKLTVDASRLINDLLYSFPAVRSVPSKLSVEAIANIRASFRESLKPKPVDNRITLTGSRGEMLGFHAQTGYPEFLKDRDLIQLKELFWLHGPDPGTFAILRPAVLVVT